MSTAAPALAPTLAQPAFLEQVRQYWQEDFGKRAADSFAVDDATLRTHATQIFEGYLPLMRAQVETELHYKAAGGRLCTERALKLKFKNKDKPVIDYTRTAAKELETQIGMSKAKAVRFMGLVIRSAIYAYHTALWETDAMYLNHDIYPTVPTHALARLQARA